MSTLTFSAANSSSPYGSVMSAEIDLQWRTLHDLGRSLTACDIQQQPTPPPTRPPGATDDEDDDAPQIDVLPPDASTPPLRGHGAFRDGRLLLPRDTSQARDAVRAVGEHVEASVAALQRSIDDHFVRFFEHIKRQADQELSLWMPKHANAVTFTDVVKEHAAAQQSSTIPAAQKPSKPEMAASVDALHAWLFVELEAIMTATRGTRGAVYLRSAEGSGYVRAALRYPPDADLPLDMALASGSTIGVVVLTSIGVNIERSRHAQQETLADELRQPERLTAPPLRVRTALVLPIPTAGAPSGTGAAGCLVIADKLGGCFDAVDEQRAWAFCIAAQAVVHRYGVAPFVAMKSGLMDAAVPALRATSLFPPAHECPWTTDAATQKIPTWDARMLVMRGGTAEATLTAKDVAAQAVPGNDEDIMESVAPYVLNLEALWRKALDGITELRSQSSKQDSLLSAKQSRIVDLEVSLRNMTKTIARLRADVNVLKRAAPGHLKSEFSTSAERDASAPAIEGPLRLASPPKPLALPPIPPLAVPHTARPAASSSSVGRQQVPTYRRNVR